MRPDVQNLEPPLYGGYIQTYKYVVALKSTVIMQTFSRVCVSVPTYTTVQKFGVSMFLFFFGK